MANEKHAYITVNGDPRTRKGSNPSGYIVNSGHWPKNFRDLKAAVLWAMKKGYVVHMVGPKAASGVGRYDPFEFHMAQEAAVAAMSAPVEEEEVEV